jgi:hypothetical protein
LRGILLCNGRAVDGFFGFLRGGWSRLIFLGVELRLILFREDVFALQIFGSVDVLGFLLLGFLAGAFLASGFGDVLRIRVRGDESGAGENQYARQTETEKASEGAHGCHGAERNLGVEIRYCHSKPTKDGGTPLQKSIAKSSYFGKRNFGPAGRPRMASVDR